MRRLHTRLPWVLAASLAVAIAAAPSSVRAQDTTFTRANGWMWGVATFELTLGVGILVASAVDTCQSWGCGVLALAIGGGALAAAITAGLLARAYDTPPDIPFAVHNTIWGALTGGLGGFAFAKLYASTDEAATVAGLSTAAGIGLGLGAYSLVRGDELMRSPRTLGAAHFIAWGVPAVGLLSMIALSSLDIPSEGAALLYALSTLVAYGVGIGWAEMQIAKGDRVGAATPMLSWSGAF